jgi:hypothetical protein
MRLQPGSMPSRFRRDCRFRRRRRFGAKPARSCSRCTVSTAAAGQMKVALSLAHHDAPPHITVLIDPCCLDCRCGSPGLEPVPPRPYERAETNPDNVALENRVVILGRVRSTKSSSL